jgi:hypothetical protein
VNEALCAGRIRVLLRKSMSLPAVGMHIMGKEDLPENEMFQECIPLHRVTLASCWLQYAAE